MTRRSAPCMSSELSTSLATRLKMLPSKKGQEADQRRSQHHSMFDEEARSLAESEAVLVDCFQLFYKGFHKLVTRAMNEIVYSERRKAFDIRLVSDIK